MSADRETQSPVRQSSEGEEVLQVKDLTKRFGGLTAVDGLSFSIREGEILGFIGPNGAGKSTTFNCIVGTHTPTSGTVRFKGADLTNAPTHEMVQRGLARTFQTSRPLNDRTVFDNIDFARSSRRSESAGGSGRSTEDICRLVGLGEKMDVPPDELTHAGLIRLEVGRALATDPDLMLVDEPFAGLSSGEVADLSELITDLRQEGMTFIVVDHNMRGLLTLIDRAIVINNGKKIADGIPSKIRNDPTVQEAYMGEEGISSDLTPAGETVTDTGQPVLETTDLSVSYGHAQALRSISLDVRENELVALIGPNGAGKTTFANAISGFLPYEGAVSYRGEEVESVGQTGLVERGLIHCTEKRDLFDFMDVEDNLRLGTSARGKDTVETRLEFVFDVFPRLEERRTQMARTLSGGEQQMLAIGRALMGDPELLILDEPTLGLAPIVLEDISNALDTIQAEGVSVLLTEQNVTFALEHADRIFLLENGKIIRAGTPREFQDSDYIAETYLGQ